MCILKFEYKGEKYPVLLTRLHTISEISNITGIPTAALRNRLRNTDLITDTLLYLHNLPKKVHKIKFNGEHNRFVNGEEYTTTEYAQYAGIDNSTMWGRIRGKNDVTPHDLRAPDAKYSKKGNYEYTSSLENRVDRESQKWLSRKLV